MARMLGTSPLHLYVISATGAPTLRLRVDTAEYWTLENVTVLVDVREWCADE